MFSRPVLALLFGMVFVTASTARAGDRFFQWTGGVGYTNDWFDHDVCEDIMVYQASGAWGFSMSASWDFLLSLDIQRYDVENDDTYYSYGVTPRFRFREGRFIAEGGIGLMRHDVPIEGFSYRNKWSPQIRVGWMIHEQDSQCILLSYTLAHYSHSMLTDRRNIGLNTNGVELSFIHSF